MRPKSVCPGERRSLMKMGVEGLRVCVPSGGSAPHPGLAPQACAVTHGRFSGRSSGQCLMEWAGGRL